MYTSYPVLYAYYNCPAPLFYYTSPPNCEKCQQVPEVPTKHEPSEEPESISDQAELSNSSSFKVSRVQARRNANRRSNDTKNIPKNYGRAIMNFILQQRDTLQRVIKKFPDIKIFSFLREIQKKRTSINSIADLRQLWLPKTSQATVCRIMSRLFLQRHCLSHIYNSRILNHSNHIKYRYRMLEGVARPRDFNSIKEY